ncbi:MAG: hypothetical protein ACRDUS_07785 [Mycobacterium sp.]
MACLSSSITTNIAAGSCDARFGQVRDEFEGNFTERGELGPAWSSIPAHTP